MAEQQKGSVTPFPVNNLVARTQRLDSAGSSRSIGSPIDTFKQTQERYNKATNGSDISDGDDDEMENHNFNHRQQGVGDDARISISESCIESESDSGIEDDQSNVNISPVSMINDSKIQSSIPLVHSKLTPFYTNTDLTSTRSLDALEEETTSEEDSAIMRDDEDEEEVNDERDNEEEGADDNLDYDIENDDGRLPSAGNYLSGLKGSQSTILRTTSISNTKKPTIETLKENMDHNILSRASPIHKYKQRSKSFGTGLVQKKNRRSSSSSTSSPLVTNTQYQSSKTNNSPSDPHMLLKHNTNPQLSKPNLHKFPWRVDGDGVPLLLQHEQTDYFISQYIQKYPSYMKNSSLENLEHIHEQGLIKNKEFDSSEYINFMEYPTLNLLDMMSCLLTKIVQTNDDLGKNTQQNDDSNENKNNSNNNISSSTSTSLSNRNKTLLFRGQNIPHFPINKYLQRAHQYCATSNDVYLSLLVYFDRLSQLTLDDSEPKLILDSYNIHRLIITAFTVATKFSQDVYFTNKRYAKVGGISDRELNKLELAFLDLLNWEKLRCSGIELLKYWKLLNGFWERENENKQQSQESQPTH